MNTFKTYYFESKSYPIINCKDFYESKRYSTISVFDVDETLFNTYANIIIRDETTGNEIKRLTNQQFNGYTLKAGEKFDFSEFRDSEKFVKTSKPIKSTIEQVHKEYSNPDTMIVFLTARENFDSNTTFKSLFKVYGIQVKDRRVTFELSGNLKQGGTSDKKKFIVDKFIRRFSPKTVKIWDDHLPNLKIADDLSKTYPNIEFIKMHVLDGKSKRI